MAYTGVLTRIGRCAICKMDMHIGETVYHDPTKRQGSHLAHVKCWDDLLADRKAKGVTTPRGSREILSTEPLDPMF